MKVDYRDSIIASLRDLSIIRVSVVSMSLRNSCSSLSLCWDNGPSTMICCCLDSNLPITLLAHSYEIDVFQCMLL